MVARSDGQRAGHDAPRKRRDVIDAAGDAPRESAVSAGSTERAEGSRSANGSTDPYIAAAGAGGAAS